MGATLVQAKVFGENDTREYTFMVDTGSTFLALPQEEIDALGLRRAQRNGQVDERHRDGGCRDISC